MASGTDSKRGHRNWLPVICLTFSAFIFNTSEFIPIGLLSDIASHLLSGISKDLHMLMISRIGVACALCRPDRTGRKGGDRAQPDCMRFVHCHDCRASARQGHRALHGMEVYR